MRVYRNSHKLKIPLATTICGEGDFDKRGVLTHPRLQVRELKILRLNPVGYFITGTGR